MKHVLVCRLDSDGDVLLAGPAVRAVAAAGARVTLLCGPRGRRAAELLPGLDDLVCFRAPWIDPEPERVDRAAVLALADDLAARALDEAAILTSFHQSPLPTALVLRLAGIRRIAAISDDYPGSLLDDRLADPGDVHEVERGLGIVRALGYELPPGDDGGLAVRRPRAGAASPAGEAPYVVVHPGAWAPARTWPAERWTLLVQDLVTKCHKVVVTGSPTERELTAAVAGEDALDLGGRTDLATLAEVLASADAVVVGNTGPAHLAAAVGAPVVSLFAPVVPAARWRPWRVPHVLLGDQTAPCAGSRARTCPVAGHPCLNGVTVDAVVEALAALVPERLAA